MNVDTTTSERQTSRLGLVITAGMVVLAGAVYVGTPYDWPETAAGAAGLLFLVAGLRSVRQWVSTRGVRQASIGDLEGYAGAVAVEGTVRDADETVTAPMTGTECTAYLVAVSEYHPKRTSGD